MLVNSTPAGCVQIGPRHNHHYIKGEEKPRAVDLVVSAPNLGGSTTSLSALSSGTIGGAMEAVLYGKRSIALSFEPRTKTDSNNPDLVTDASRHSVRLIDHLYGAWEEDVDLYSVNVPLRPRSSGDRKILYTRIRPNRWLSEKPFQHVPLPDNSPRDIYSPLMLRWAPDLAEIHGSADYSSPVDDDWVVRGGNTRCVLSSS